MAIGLARFGHTACYLSALPDNDLGRFVAGELRRHGVNLDGVLFVPNTRAGVYFVEFAVPPRAVKVIYDRAGSAFAQVAPDALKWDVLAGATLLHLTGITVAVNPRVAARGLVEAKRHGVKISFDLNYRRKLWSPEEARAGVADILGRVDVIITTREDAQAVLQLDGTAQEIAQALFAMYSPQVAVVTDAAAGAAAADPGGVLWAEGYDVQVLDRIGAGDAFAAGFINGWLDQGTLYGLRLGLAMAALKHTYHGDVAWVDPAVLRSLLERTTSAWR